MWDEEETSDEVRIKWKRISLPNRACRLGFCGKMEGIHHLSAVQREKRYGELKKNILGVNHKMLAEQLRELEEAGIVKREVYPVVPPKVEYELTELGQGLGPVIEYLREWGEHFQTEAPEESLSTAHGS